MFCFQGLICKELFGVEAMKIKKEKVAGRFRVMIQVMAEEKIFYMGLRMLLGPITLLCIYLYNLHPFSYS